MATDLHYTVYRKANDHKQITYDHKQITYDHKQSHTITNNHTRLKTVHAPPPLQTQVSALGISEVKLTLPLVVQK